MPQVYPYETPWLGGEKNNLLQRRTRIYICNLFMLKMNDKTPQLREEKNGIYVVFKRKICLCKTSPYLYLGLHFAYYSRFIKT